MNVSSCVSNSSDKNKSELSTGEYDLFDLFIPTIFRYYVWQWKHDYYMLKKEICVLVDCAVAISVLLLTRSIYWEM